MTEVEITTEKEIIKDQEIPYDLKNFKLSKILSNNTSRKTCVLLGKFKDSEEQALLILEKSAFTESDVTTDDNEKSYFVNFSKVETLLLNSEYGSFRCFPEGALNGEFIT